MTQEKYYWFLCKKILQKLKYFNLNANGTKDIFSSCFVGLTTLTTSEIREWKSGFKAIFH